MKKQREKIGRSRIARQLCLIGWAMGAWLGGATTVHAQTADQQLTEMLESLNKGESIVGKKIELRNIQFETGKTALDPGSQDYLIKIAEFVNLVPNVNLELAGHTDNVGTPTENKKLSEDRALAVKEFFVSKGVDPGRLTTVGHGSSLPISDNNSEMGRYQNRRVELKVVSLANEAVQAQDILELKDGTKIGVVYLLVKGDIVEFRTFTDTTRQSLPTASLKTVRYADGRTSDFSPKTQPAPAPQKAEPNPQATQEKEYYHIFDVMYYIEYFKGPAVRSKRFEDIDISSWEDTGLDPGYFTDESRVRIPLAQNQFKESTNGILFGAYMPITKRISALGEWQISGSYYSFVSSIMFGAHYNVLDTRAFTFSGVAKLGSSSISADIGELDYVGNHLGRVEVGSLDFVAGDEITAKVNKLSYQIGACAELNLIHRQMKFRTQLGLGGSTIGSTRLYADQSWRYGGERVRMDLKDPAFVQPDGSSSRIPSKPALGSFGPYFSMGLAYYLF